LISYPGYKTLQENGQTVIYLENAGDCLVGGLRGDNGDPFSDGGRGSVKKLSCENGHSAIIRPYLRGGFIRHFNKDRYLTNRAKMEFEILLDASSKGLSVPLPLGVLWSKRGPFFTGVLATEEFSGIHLQEYLSNETSPPNQELVKRIGVAIRTLHENSIVHADLQVRNILVDAADSKVLIIDLDKAYSPKQITPLQRQSNWRRLLRSFGKNDLPIEIYSSMLEAYGEGHSDQWISHLLKSVS
jgi:tRNA A-37 threonylcarbamoyl transferase component Bud32